MYIVNYHNIVGDDYDHFDESIFSRISAKQFERDLGFLHSKFKFISLQKLVCSLQNKRLIPNVLAFTFDDGYKGVYQFGLPLLESYNAVGTILIITSYPSNTENRKPCFWFDQLEIAFRVSKKTRADFSGLGLGLGIVDLATAQNRIQHFQQLKSRLKKISLRKMEVTYARILSRLEVSEEAIIGYATAHDKYMAMNWDEVRVAFHRGHCIGSHTVSHRPLTQLSLQEIEREVHFSFEAIRNNIASDWVPFAYPYGKSEHISQQIAHLIKETGYQCALTMLPGPNLLGADTFELKRVELEDGKFICA